MSSSLPSCHMEQGYTPPRKQPQGVALGWTQQSVLPFDVIEAPSQSASSAVISPASPNTNDAASECSGQSTSSLKERDYIGLAEVSSAPSSLTEPEVDAELNLSETDLRLGWGPASDVVDNAPEPLRNEALDAIPSSTSHNVEATDVAACIRDDVNSSRSISSTWQAKSFVSSTQIPHMNGFQGSAGTAASKNGGKRMYAEAMVHVSRESRPIMNLNSSAGTANVCDPRLGANQIVPSKHFPDPDMMSHPLHPQGVYWATPHVSSWQPQSNYCSVATQKGMAYAGEKDGEVPRNANLDLTYRSDNTQVQSVASDESVPDEAPPAKGQVVGWPPVRSYRRSTLATRTKPPGDAGDGQSAVYVKVNMEGIPIGRKVDLNAYKSYESLLSALEDMFHNPNSGLGARFLKGSEFVLTYEDKEGDWMLVGDVPWGMFVNTVRRLRITRGSDMTGLGSRASCHT